MRLFNINFSYGIEYFVPHSELALHLGIAGRRLIRAKVGGRYCWVKVAGDSAIHHGLQSELLPISLPDLTNPK